MITVTTNKKGELIRTPKEKRQAVLLFTALTLALYVGFDFGSKYQIIPPQIAERVNSEDIITYQQTNDIDVLKPQPISEVEDQTLDGLFAEVIKPKK
jgi:predicted polyphosphate/ATP-dependent NAD kinase